MEEDEDQHARSTEREPSGIVLNRSTQDETMARHHITFSNEDDGEARVKACIYGNGRAIRGKDEPL